MKNNRGQVLVLFVVLIPVLLILATFVVDMGQALYKSNELNNLTKEVIRYGLRHIEDADVNDKMISLIYKNDSDIDEYTIVTKDNEINLKLKTTSKSMFGKAIGIKVYYVSANYIGHIDVDGKIVIEKG